MDTSATSTSVPAPADAPANPFRGVPLAQRLVRLIAEHEGCAVPVGSLDITYYRDDLTRIAHAPIVKRSDAMPEVSGRTVVLVDDVLFTGRTVRAALDAITDHGRPRAVRAVARACATNPVSVVVPCHRVVREDGKLAGYRWGLERKQRLLENEKAGAKAKPSSR